MVGPVTIHQTRHTTETVHTPTEAAETPEAPDVLGQPVMSAETESVAALTGETLLIQPFPAD